MRHLLAIFFTLVMLLLAINGCASPDMQPTAGSASLQATLPSARIGGSTSSPQPTPLSTSTLSLPSPSTETGAAANTPIPSPLNEGVEFSIYAQFPDIPEFIAPDYARPPTGTRYIIDVDVPCGWTTPLYAVIGELTALKWHLAEYDALIQNCFRGDMVGGGSVLALFSEEQLGRYTDERYRHYLYLQTVLYPREVLEVHELYFSCLVSPQSYWDIYDPTVPFETTTPYWRINAKYWAFGCQKEMAEADYRFYALLEEEGIYPLIR